MALRNHWPLPVLILSLLLCYSESSPCGIPKAYGGADIEQYLQDGKLVLPWTVAIASKLGQFKCLGSLIPEGFNGQKKNGSSWVVTAGNCFRYNFLKRWGSTSSFRVFAGIDRFWLFGSGEGKAYVKRIKIFQFIAGDDNIWHGIALVNLKEPFMFSKRISPVCISEQLIPPKDSKCFVSTYVKSRLDEEVVDLVPGAICDFGQFPELKRVGGICSIHREADTEKSFGGPLVCLVNGRAYQFGVYLSQLSVKDAFSFQNNALHYYGHTAKLFANDPSLANYVVRLGSEPSTSREVASNACDPSESNLAELGGSSCSQKPVKPVAPAVQPEQRGPPLCGTTGIFGRTLESYIEGSTARDMFPWNVFIVTKMRGIVKCIGSVIHAGKYEQHANASDVVLTAAGCFDQGPSMPELLISRMSVYASSNKFSWHKRDGIKLSVVSARSFGQKYHSEVTLMRLQRPLSLEDRVISVCLARREEIPPLDAFCYVTHYDTQEQRIDEDPVSLTHKRTCSLDETAEGSDAEGLCTTEEKPRHYIQLGAPMVCIVDGRAYQYGVYQRQHSLRINDRVTQQLGFYSRISSVYDALYGESVVNTSPPGDEPTAPSVPPKETPPIYIREVSTSRSLSSSNEVDEKPSKPDVPVIIPSHAGPPSVSNPQEGPMYPIKPPINVNSKSSSTSLSVSKSKSSSSEQSKEEIEQLPAPSEIPTVAAGPPVLKKNETVIVVKFPRFKYPKFVPRKESKEEPVIISASSSSESRESKVPVPLPPALPTPPPDAHPLPPPPVQVVVGSASKSSSGSRSSSTSHEATKPQGSGGTELPNPVLPSGPCELDINSPNGVLICPGKGKDTLIVPLPTPAPSAEYPSGSLESRENAIYPSIPNYDMSSHTIADHEHIQISETTVLESAIAGGASSSCAIIGGESVTASHPSAVFEDTGSGSGSNIYGPAGTGTAVVSSSISGGSSGASISGTSTSVGIIHGSLGVTAGREVSAGGVYGSRGASSSATQSSVRVIHGSRGASSGVSRPGGTIQSSIGSSSQGRPVGIICGSKGTTSGVSISGGSISGSMGSSSSRVHKPIGSRGGTKGASSVVTISGGVKGSTGSSSSSIHISTGTTHGTASVSSGTGTSGASSHGSSNLPSSGTRVWGSSTGGSTSISTGGSTSAGSTNMLTQNIASNFIRRQPGANGVHIFDTSGSSAEEVCTGTLHVKAGEKYSDVVVTSARCVWSRVSKKYKVYVGSLLPRSMATSHFNRTLVSVKRIVTLPYYSEHSSLRAMGIGVLRLKHKVKVTAGVQSYSLPYPETAPNPMMQCYVSGICQHGMPVRVNYQLLSPGECRGRLGQQFLPSLQYCGIGRKDILKYPVGAPLVCEFFGNWTQFGIYDHHPRSAKLDRFGPKEEADLNEIALFMRLEAGSVGDALKGLPV